MAFHDQLPRLPNPGVLVEVSLFALHAIAPELPSWEDSMSISFRAWMSCFVHYRTCTCSLWTRWPPPRRRLTSGCQGDYIATTAESSSLRIPQAHDTRDRNSQDSFFSLLTSSKLEYIIYERHIAYYVYDIVYIVYIYIQYMYLLQ